MSKKRRNKPVAAGDVCGGFMFNAKRYVHMNDAYFTPDQIIFPYEAKKIFGRIVHELHYLNIEHGFGSVGPDIWAKISST